MTTSASGTADGRAKVGQQRRAKTRAAIIAAAFDKFGDENGLFVSIEEIVEAAGVTRATFYNHFAGMVELREALAQEVTHDFLKAVTEALNRVPDSRQRAAAGVRFYLHRARRDPRWGWSMLNMSASGQMFGAETYLRAQGTIGRGIKEGVFSLPSSEIGRDILLGTTLAALSSMMRDNLPEDYPETIAGFALCGLGVEHEDAYRFAHMPLPPIREVQQGG
ncbi:TetR/AcrR family transcriptional regulator [Aurantiacibacter suaedae]|uniref:TetR/AcrR family transcriptional regulator n=1 Tax=Aurantiacibacter suaedae TaxID=2545755 RepID=UPI0010FA0349|nr:TetR/AcrR family transcriptional regulator [Aurantiacibacter suaedae]